MKYTYACPGGPNMTSVRAVRPRAECAARSRGPRYASVSTMRPARTLRPSSCTRCIPIRARAMVSVLRSKKAREGFRTGDIARDGKGIHYNAPAALRNAQLRLLSDTRMRALLWILAALGLTADPAVASVYPLPAGRSGGGGN